MTDEERQELASDLRHAADEIERLEKERDRWKKAAETWELLATRFVNDMSEALGTAEPPSQSTVN